MAVLIGLLFTACSNTNPIEPDITGGTQGLIINLAPSLAWVDLDANTCNLSFSYQPCGPVVGDTISLMVTSWTDTIATNTTVWPYRSGTWEWSVTDGSDYYKNADSLFIMATWWNQGWPKQTEDFWVMVRLGDK
jgi:hypothetical protein